MGHIERDRFLNVLSTAAPCNGVACTLSHVPLGRVCACLQFFLISSAHGAFCWLLYSSGRTSVTQPCGRISHCPRAKQPPSRLCCPTRPISETSVMSCSSYWAQSLHSPTGPITIPSVGVSLQPVLGSVLNLTNKGLSQYLSWPAYVQRFLLCGGAAPTGLPP